MELEALKSSFGYWNFRTNNGKPTEEMVAYLKKNGYRWSKNNGCWYPATSDAKEKNLHGDFAAELQRKFDEERTALERNRRELPSDIIEQLVDSATNRELGKERVAAVANSIKASAAAERTVLLEKLVEKLREQIRLDQEKIQRYEAELAERGGEEEAAMTEQEQIDAEAEWEKENALTEEEERAVVEKHAEPQIERVTQTEDALALSPEELAAAKTVMPDAQYRTTLNLAQGEEREFFIEKLKSLAAAVNNAPKIGDGYGAKEHPIVFRYFHPTGTETLVTEIGSDGEAYGFQCLNGDYEMAEWGYLDLNEIKGVRMMEIDYHVPEGMTVEKWLYKNHPEEFPQYAEIADSQEKTPFDIAPYKELRIAASQKTVDWNDEKAVKEYWSERLGEKLADSFATLDFKPDEWSELLNKGADAREAIKVAAADANLGDNLNWLLDNVPQEKLSDYFSDKKYCEDVFEIAKDSFIRSGFGDKYEASDIYTGAFVKLSELAGKNNEMREFGEKLMLDAGIAVKVFPYAKDSQSVEAVRDFLGEINGYSSDQVGNGGVRAVIDNIDFGDRSIFGTVITNGYLLIGTKGNLGFVELHNKESVETNLSEIFSSLEFVAIRNFIDTDKKFTSIRDKYAMDKFYLRNEKEKAAARIEKIFDGIQSELGNGSAQTFAEMREWLKENFPGKTDRENSIDAASRMIEGAADFGELNAEEFDARYGNGEASEKRMDIADFAADRVFTGMLSSWKEIQTFVSKESEKFMRETKGELEKEILSEIKENWTFGDATVPDAVKIYNPKNFGLEDNGKLHVLLQFHISDSNEFGSAMSEDGLFNLINSDWQDGKFGGLEIDFNPIEVAKSGTIEEYLANMKSHYEKELTEEKNSDIHKTIVETVEKNVDEVFKEKFPLALNEGREVAVPLEQAHLETAEEIESFMAKEAEEYVANKSDKGNFDVEKFGAAFFSESSMRNAYRDAATFGYNMAKNNITELQEKYDKLLSEHEKLQADYDKLLDNFNNLSSGRAKRQKNSGMCY